MVEALALANDALRIQPGSTWALLQTTGIQYGDGDRAGAIAGFQKLIESRQGQAEYWRLYIWLARVRLGEAKEASEALRSSFLGEPIPGAWPGPAAAFLLGELDEAGLFKAAEKGEPKIAAGQRMAAHYHAGFRRLVAGDVAGAKEQFRKCVATRLFQHMELAWAQDELRALETAKK
jgi:lipoprotein NlpI